MSEFDQLEKLKIENEELKIENQRLSQLVESSERRLGDFMRHMNHGIRTPLNATIGLTNLMLRSKLSEEEAKAYLGTIEQSGIMVQRLLNDLLDYSYLETEEIHLEEDEYNFMDLFTEIDGELKVRMKGKGIRECVDLDPDLPTLLYGDKNRLKQIILSVINNAIRFTRRGSIFVKVRVDYLDDSDRAVLFFSVRDTGLGFDEQTIDHIFDPFGSNEKLYASLVDGTGLELSIARRLVEIMSGGIQAHSEKGVGTEIFFTIPQKV
ncbi:MAG: HAMP domain-containing histidine kinase, partial [Lachnospiraceae bacterium]|nr:HAMP domain-containing histidine kinase [Lachnospiraceae bacterium]